MTSGHYKCETELSLTDIEEGEVNQIGSGIYFHAIHDILKKEVVKEEATEIKPFTNYGNEQNANGNQFGGVHILKREIIEEEPTENKPFSIYEAFNEPIEKIFWENTNNIEMKTETLKTEDEIDIIYEDFKSEICLEKSSGKSENMSYPISISSISIGTEIGPKSSHELPIDSATWTEQNIDGGMAVERDNDTRKERTMNQSNLKQSLEKHEIIRTGKKTFQCIFCSKLFSQKGHLMAHERIHTGEKPFQCEICSKSFNKKENLKTHQRIHIGEKLFQCKICSKSFLKKQNLKAHEMIHTEEKPFQCKLCSKSFYQKENLNTHKRIHTGEKPFQCKICSKSFNRKDNLKTHERMHTEEEQFQCQICSKSFSQKKNLYRHTRIHTEEKPFQCKICSKSFRWKDNLKRHERIH